MPAFVFFSACSACMLVLTAVTFVTEADRAASRSSGRYFAAAAGLACAAVFASPAILGLLRGSFGRVSITGAGVEVLPLCRPTRLFAWDEVESVRWAIGALTVRAAGGELTIAWASLPARAGPDAREWVRDKLTPSFQVIDIPRRQPTSVVRILLASTACTAPMLAGTWYVTNHPESMNRPMAAALLGTPLLAVVILTAAVAYANRNRHAVWYTRRADQGDAVTSDMECRRSATFGS